MIDAHLVFTSSAETTFDGGELCWDTHLLGSREQPRLLSAPGNGTIAGDYYLVNVAAVKIPPDILIWRRAIPKDCRSIVFYCVLYFLVWRYVYAIQVFTPP